MHDNSSLPPVAKRSKPFTHLNGMGHRVRMRNKLLEKGADILEDYEVLEMLLYLVIPRKDTKPFAKKLINLFGSLEKIFEADIETLSQTSIPENFIVLIDILRKISDRLIAPDGCDRPYLRRWKDVIIYLNDYKLKVETANKNIIRLLFLNGQQRLICDEYILYQGLDSISVIIKKAIELYAINLITINYTPHTVFSQKMRQQETKFALTLQSSAHPFDLNISDHIIHMDKQYFSIFKNKALDF
ncbi:JAB domain-containing protein [Commensalibacter oyaizuii]|uniref:JAB domain-containing protein n=1 Tax=Commensalibacter oyaizuii TaxID=3043873 RepID=A0ABT6PZF8_9PROT|nr:JAB domain-containing protein [Commensalibacter sp. TBRC 16381]MDI2090204.1 JAB domain-containing protein [Commensalibacter sp. TBRC 16381]